MIIDNFLETFNNMSREDISGAQENAKHLAGMALQRGVEIRQDMLTWLVGMDCDAEHSSSMCKLVENVSAFKGTLNGVSQEGKGDRSLRVDK